MKDNAKKVKADLSRIQDMLAVKDSKRKKNGTQEISYKKLLELAFVVLYQAYKDMSGERNERER